MEWWLAAFALTLGVEVPIVAVVTRRSGRPIAERAALGAFASLATHPVVWYVFADLPLGDALSLGLSEAFAVVTEAAFFGLVFPRLGWRRAAALSLGANAASFAAGWIAAAWLGWF